MNKNIGAHIILSTDSFFLISFKLAKQKTFQLRKKIIWYFYGSPRDHSKFFGIHAL